jgi:hypothetical protein
MGNPQKKFVRILLIFCNLQSWAIRNKNCPSHVFQDKLRNFFGLGLWSLMPLSKLCLLLMVFFSAETTCTARWHEFYIRNRHFSVSSFVYKYDHDTMLSCHDSRRKRGKRLLIVFFMLNYTLYMNAGFWLVNIRDIFYKFRPCIVNLQNLYFM